MRVTTLSVGLEMRRSNGDYGSDKAEVQLTAALDDGQDPVLALNMLIDMARETVEADLKRSPSLAAYPARQPFRPRRASSDLLERNQHIVELHAAGQTGVAIAAALQERWPSLTAVAVRHALRTHRAKVDPGGASRIGSS